MLQAAKYPIYDYFYFIILLFFSALMSHLPLLLLHSALYDRSDTAEAPKKSVHNIVAEEAEWTKQLWGRKLNIHIILGKTQ